MPKPSDEQGNKPSELLRIQINLHRKKRSEHALCGGDGICARGLADKREWLKWWAREVHRVSWIIWKTLFIKLPAIERINKKTQSALERIRATRKAT